MADSYRRLRCAIYTRKSSEEGLEQSFNSLDAQREACEAYIGSQRHEGWRALDTHYDDGGYSGGTLERPGLRELLADIEARKIDVVVVYKVDRLTRSLADFAKIVERFDAHGVSFVSVTQQFNTTSSMGRLTLNVLLSFAQFEREVTGERIRDKIAASKKKGMWMGGSVPLGYDAKNRKLIINASEAAIVQGMYRRYLDLGCVRKLMRDLKAKGIRSKRRVSNAGRASGGLLYSRGALYDILRNRLYVGEVAHRGAVYAGEHEAIVPKDIWDKVQARLQANGQARRLGVHAKAPSLLAGLLYDAEGHRFTPLHATKNGKRYRYYASQAVIRNGPSEGRSVTRFPAHDVEQLVVKRIQAFLGSSKEFLDLVAETADSKAPPAVLLQAARETAKRWLKFSHTELREFLRMAVSKIIVTSDRVTIAITKQGLGAALLNDTANLPRPTSPALAGDQELVLHVDAQLRRHGMEMRMIVPADALGDTAKSPDGPLLKALARARTWYEAIISGEISSLRALAKSAGLNERYVSRVMRLAFLAPDITDALLDGKRAPGLMLDKLMKGVPISWEEQRNEWLT
jgi:DNA invertase Pin-like site-specific DNA recombinase